MNKNASANGEGVKMQRWAPFTFWRWTSLFLASYGIGHAILVVLLGLALGLRARSLLLPYLLLLWCGFVGSCLIYWARRSYERPKSGAIRFALAVFLFLNLYLGALLLSAVKLAILSTGSALSDYAPYILLTSALGSAALYLMARMRLEAISQSGTGVGR
jgi:hypothetical protein